MALWPSKRAHLRAVDLAEVPDTGPPLNPQTHGDIMREKTDAIRRIKERYIKEFVRFVDKVSGEQDDS